MLSKLIIEQIINSQKERLNQIDRDNLDRELTGLSEAMNFFGVKEGVVVTHDQSDSFTIDNKRITAIPFYRWVTENQKYFGSRVPR